MGRQAWEVVEVQVYTPTSIFTDPQSNGPRVFKGIPMALPWPWSCHCFGERVKQQGCRLLAVSVVWILPASIIRLSCSWRQLPDRMAAAW